MGSVEKRVRDGNTSWLVRWRDPDNRQRKKTFYRKSDADRHLVAVEESVYSGTYIDTSLANVRFGDWAEKWVGTQVHLKPSTLTRYRGLLRVQILPTWERVPLAKIRHADVATWVKKLSAGGLSASTVRQAHRVFSLALDHAVLDGRLPRNPAQGVPLPRPAKREQRFLTHPEVEGLAQSCGDYQIAILLLAYCGLRFGELAALRVRRVDLMRRRITIAESVTEVSGKAVFGTPKTHQNRSVAIPRSLIEPLKIHLAGKGGDEFVFASPEGGVLRVNNFRNRVFDPAVKAMGLQGLTPHDLRHTAASLAISAGANVKAVQRMLGHASAAMTLDVYADLFEDDLDFVADQMDIARSLVPPVCPESNVTDIEKRRKAL